MDTKKKLALNTFLPIINKFIVFMCGLVLPRLFIGTYGSDVNGLIASITNFLGMIALLDMGMGAVVESSLYKPLAKNNDYEISRVVKSCRKFFNKIAIVFLVYIAILVVIYPTIIRKDFDWFFEASLIIILAIDLFANYFFGIAYSTLLKADQKAYVAMLLSCIGTLLNFGLCILLIKIGAPVHIVKLTSAIVFLIRPIYLNYYAKKYYNLDNTVDISKEPIKQKWNGIAQHFAYYVTDRTDILVLTIFSTLINVSIYSVYNMVVSGVRDIVVISQSGIQALIGNMYANNERTKLLKTFYLYEWVVHNISTILFTCTWILIIPFIRIYTSGITDANYIQPLFSIILIAAMYIYCLRYPYHVMVLAAGHYKQTQTSSIIEMVLNVVITVFLVFHFGLVGVAVGTFISLAYRTIYLVHYNHNIIEEYKMVSFYKLLISNTIIIAFSFAASYFITINVTGYITWAGYAFIVFFVVVVVCIIVNSMVHRKYIKIVYNYLKRKRSR